MVYQKHGFLFPDLVHRSRSDRAANANANSDAPRKFASEFSPPNLKQKVANSALRRNVLKYSAKCHTPNKFWLKIFLLKKTKLGKFMFGLVQHPSKKTWTHPFYSPKPYFCLVFWPSPPPKRQTPNAVARRIAGDAQQDKGHLRRAQMCPPTRSHRHRRKIPLKPLFS